LPTGRGLPHRRATEGRGLPQRQSTRRVLDQRQRADACAAGRLVHAARSGARAHACKRVGADVPARRRQPPWAPRAEERQPSCASCGHTPSRRVSIFPFQPRRAEEARIAPGVHAPRPGRPGRPGRSAVPGIAAAACPSPAPATRGPLARIAAAIRSSAAAGHGGPPSAPHAARRGAPLAAQAYSIITDRVHTLHRPPHPPTALARRLADDMGPPWLPLCLWSDFRLRRTVGAVENGFLRVL
jgi:hypothetical protein